MEETLDNFSNNNSSQHAFIRESSQEETDYSSQNSLGRSLLNNKLISFCLILSLMVFFGVIICEKNKVFSRFMPRLRGHISLQNNYIVTSIEHRFPVLIRSNDPNISDQLRYGSSSKSIFDDAASSLCTTGSTVVEVSARYGYNAIVLGQILKSGGKYIAIESNPIVARCLYKNIILNDLSRTVEIVRKSVSDHQGTCTVEDVVSDSSEDGSKGLITKKLKAECDSLDGILQGRAVSLILIDVSSYVFDILRGANKTIESSTGNLQILVNLDLDEISKSVNVRRELSSLRQLGMRFYEVTSATDIRAIGIDEIIEKNKLIVLMKKEK